MCWILILDGTPCDFRTSKLFCISISLPSCHSLTPQNIQFIMSALTQTDFNFPGQQSVYHGKVRDVYHLGDRLVMVATDRISAFDVASARRHSLQGSGAQPDCCPVPRRYRRHLPQLEARYARSHGYSGFASRGIPRRNDCARLSLR